MCSSSTHDSGRSTSSVQRCLMVSVLISTGELYTFQSLDNYSHSNWCALPVTVSSKPGNHLQQISCVCHKVHYFKKKLYEKLI